jgi:hypothetical protein
MASHRKIKYSIKYSNTLLYEQYLQEFSFTQDKKFNEFFFNL